MIYLIYDDGYYSDETFETKIETIWPGKNNHTFGGYANKDGDVVIRADQCQGISELNNKAFSEDTELYAVWRIKVTS